MITKKNSWMQGSKMCLQELNEFTLVKMSLHELKDDKSEEKWKN